MLLISLSSSEQLFLLLYHQMEKQNRETRECNFLANQMKTLRFPSLTVPLNSGTTAGRYAWTFKDVFPKGERNRK